MADSVFGAPTQTNSLSAAPSSALEQVGDELAQPDPFNEARLLDLFQKMKRESTDYRWIWEREWLRDLYYVANRQWIFYHPSRREWVDKRLQKWIPRPVTNKMAETLQAIRSNLSAIQLSVIARPVGHDTQSIGAAEIADQMAPLIHEEHNMNQVMRECDFWLIATGNACLHISWDLDKRSNRTFIPFEQCLTCGTVSPPQAVAQAGNVCPSCGNPTLQMAPGTDGPNKDATGQWIAFGKGKTSALSPFEYAFPPNVTRWDDLPYLIRIRWRDKHWFEANKPELVNKITWEKSPSERSMQIFKSLALTNDVGTGSQFSYMGTAGSHAVDGITEYEVWLKPTPDFPEGLVFRVLGDQSPILLQSPEESLPGPFPYKDIEGNPLFPFFHSQYEHMGGRLYGRSAISPLIQKQDQLNQLDSMVQLCVQRMSNPVWVLPEGAGIENITGEPGLQVKWNPLSAGGQGKPERQAGIPLDGSLFEFRAQILKDIEDLSGAFDIIKGQKPSGVEAFSALQLLVERSQSRFTGVFQSRGEMYRRWFGLAIELERTFGPQQRTQAIVGPNKGYTFQHFENAQLQGQISFVIEDGTNMPKTALGKRAAIEQANQLHLLDPNDPDQKHALLTQFGLSDLVPSLNTHVNAALQMQDQFEKWAENPQGPPPLDLKPWYNLNIHLVERIKWLNTDRMRGIMAQNPALEPLLANHIMQMQILTAPAPMVGPDGKPLPGAPQGPGGPPSGAHAPGGGQAMTQSNRQSGAPQKPSHEQQVGQPQGVM